MHGLPETLVLASNNRGKLRELQRLMAPLGLHLRRQGEWDFPEAVEDAPGFIENALIKARHAAAHTGLPALADDSGLVVPHLNGEPGIHSARFAGRHGDDEGNNRKLLRCLEGVTSEQRAAYFYCAMALVRHPDDPAPWIATGQWHGVIASAPSGEGGFGYDPLFLLPERGCTSAELPPETKNRLSHRGQAVRALMRQLGDGND